MRSAALFRRARKVMPGGVSSPVRSFASVGGEPFFVSPGRGARVRDADGVSYLDYVMSVRAAPLRPRAALRASAVAARAPRRDVLRRPDRARGAARRARRRGSVPSIEMVRFVNSGTEAAMSAIRLARARDGPAPDREDRRRHITATRTPSSSRPARASRPSGIAGSPGVPEGAAALDDCRSLQRRGRARSRVRPIPRRDRGVHPRAGRREHGPRSPAAGVPRGRAGAHDAPRRSSRLRRGHLGLPAARAAGRRSSRAFGPT